MGPGEGWIDIFGPGYNWMQIAYQGSYDLQSADTPLPTVAPGDVATRETCFRLPDGWSVCTLANDVFATDYAGMGYPQIPQSAPEFIPPDAVESTRYDPPPVVSSDPPPDLQENASTVAINWGDIGRAAADMYTSINQLGNTPVYNFGGTAGTGAVPPVDPGPMNSCSCNSNPCVCGVINGRPALVDPRTGKRCYRRRRRVMLTEGDFNTLLRIATLPNNANVRTALAKAIGRR